MDHAGNLPLIFRFDRDTVSPIAHSDDRILQIVPGASVDKAGKLGMYAVIGNFHVTADTAEAGACIVADLILRENTAPDLSCERSEGRKPVKHGIQ